jgi:predicted kinase
MEIDSSEPLLILLHGGPATGKTTLGLRLAETFGIPYFSKDGVKEPIFDHVGLPVAWETEDGLSGRDMDEASKTILICIIEALLVARASCIIDSTFLAPHAPRFQSLRERHAFRLVQILCRTEAGELRRRLAGRAANPSALNQRQSTRLIGTWRSAACRSPWTPPPRRRPRNTTALWAGSETADTRWRKQ